MIRPDIELHIEELVLDGFDGLDRRRIGEAVEQELTRLFAEHGLERWPRDSVQAESLDGGAFNLAPRSTPERTGMQVAQAVHRGIDQWSRG